MAPADASADGAPGGAPAGGPAAAAAGGSYNPRPLSPALARIRIVPVAADEAGSPRVAAHLDVAQGGASSLSSVATLCNSAVGAGAQDSGPRERAQPPSVPRGGRLLQARQHPVPTPPAPGTPPSSAGVLSLPFAFRCAGLLGGLVLCLVVGAAESFSLYVLSKFAERYDAHSYGSLIRRALGRKLASALSAILLLYCMGSCTAYLVRGADV